MEESKFQSRYQWCLEKNIRPLDLHESEEYMYMFNPISGTDFAIWVLTKTFKTNSTPRKPEKYLELRMYGFVPYNISDIQKGIQFDHACKEYTIKHGSDEDYQTYLREWKTDIILNGGTSNVGMNIRHGFKDVWYVGTINQHLKALEDNNIKHAEFYEPDLNNMLSAVVFLVDERVFNKELYPDFKSSPYPWPTTIKGRVVSPNIGEMAKWKEDNDKNYQAWEEKIGGPKNAFLRELLKDKRLA